MVYGDLSEDEIEKKAKEMEGLAVASTTLANMGKEDKQITERLKALWALERIAEERLTPEQLASYTQFTMAMGAGVSNVVGSGAPAWFAHAVSVGFQVGHDYVVKYGKLLED